MNELIQELRDALLANQVFHTPVELRRRGGQWNVFEIDAIQRTRDALSKIPRADYEGYHRGYNDGCESEIEKVKQEKLSEFI